MPHPVPETGGTFTYGPADGQWWWSQSVFELHQLTDRCVPGLASLVDVEHGATSATTIHEAVRECLAFGTRFGLVVPYTTPSEKQRWLLWTGERTGTAPEARVAGRVLDVSAAFQRALSAQFTDHLGAALAGRQTIDLVKGAFMLAYGVDADAAFDLLVWYSQRSNVRVHDLAERVAGALVAGGGRGAPTARDALERALVGRPASQGAHPIPNPNPGCREPLSLRPSLEGDAQTVLAVAGTVDLGSAPQLSTAVVDLLQRLASGAVLVVDLSEVDHLGPVGVFVLESLSRRARAAGVELRVVAAPELYRDVLTRAELSSET